MPDLATNAVAYGARAALQSHGFISHSPWLARWRLEARTRPVYVEHISNTGGSMLCDVIMSHRGCRNANSHLVGHHLKVERRTNCKPGVENHFSFMRAASLVNDTNHRYACPAARSRPREPPWQRILVDTLVQLLCVCVDTLVCVCAAP